MSKPRTPTRERILDAALDLFLERGVAGTTVSDIERAVGLAAGTGSFYRHFRSKEELVIPAFQRGLSQVVQQLDAARASDDETDDQRELTLRDYHALLRNIRHIHPLWVLLLAERAHFPELLDVFIDTLGMREWELRWDENRVRTVVIAALAGFNQLSILDEAYYATIEPDEFVTALVDLTELAESQLSTPLGHG